MAISVESCSDASYRRTDQFIRAQVQWQPASMIPSCVEKMMDGRSCMLELEEAWMEEGLDLQLYATEALKSQI